MTTNIVKITINDRLYVKNAACHFFIFYTKMCTGVQLFFGA